VHFFGVRALGLRKYLRRYIQPNFILLPLNVLAEITRTFSLMVRLFGNMMSHAFVIAIVVLLAGLLVPVPFMLLGILIGIIQAYIFTVLAAVFIGAGVGALEKS
jgi:F-type H+-transporting ATPase subunit a